VLDVLVFFLVNAFVRVFDDWAGFIELTKTVVFFLHPLVSAVLALILCSFRPAFPLTIAKSDAISGFFRGKPPPLHVTWLLGFF